jgi:hypothetical protein
MAFSCEIMKDPVVAADGYTYNRKEIEQWFAEHNVRTFRHSFVPPFFLSFFSKTSPKTSQALPHKMLIPNMDLRARVIAWRDAHGLPAPRIANPKDVDVPGPVSASNQGNKGRESVLRDGKEKTQQIKHDLAHFNAVFMPTIIFAFALVCLCDSKENSARLGYPFTLVLSAIMACDAHTLLCPSSCMFFECHLHSYKLSAVINLPRAIISHFFLTAQGLDLRNFSRRRMVSRICSASQSSICVHSDRSDAASSLCSVASLASILAPLYLPFAFILHSLW